MDQLLNFKTDDTGIAIGKIPNECLYHVYTMNEIREMYNLDPIDSGADINDAPQHSETKQITNCVNCGAPVDPRHDHCEYCGTSYRLMGMTLRNEIDALTLENKAINASIDITRQYQELIASLSRRAKIIRRY